MASQKCSPCCCALPPSFPPNSRLSAFRAPRSRSSISTPPKRAPGCVCFFRPREKLSTSPWPRESGLCLLLGPENVSEWTSHPYAGHSVRSPQRRKAKSKGLCEMTGRNSHDDKRGYRGSSSCNVYQHDVRAQIIAQHIMIGS